MENQMNEILTKLINGEEIKNKDICDALWDICSSVHASCDSECPVFKKNNGIPWNKDLTNCICFKNGGAMLRFLRKEYK